MCVCMFACVCVRVSERELEIFRKCLFTMHPWFQVRRRSCTELHVHHHIHLPERPGAGQSALSCPAMMRTPSHAQLLSLLFTLYVFVQGSPQMLKQQGCVFLFEWATPIVCSDTKHINGCKLTDSQLQFTFDLSTLTGEVQVSSTDSESVHQQ